jgi:hypothetical protein
MSTNIVALRRGLRQNATWSSRELSEFYRVEAILVQSGLRIDTEQGISDEGDPWFAFCRADDGEVIVHIARIRGLYLLAGPCYDRAASGSDISALVRDLVARHPLVTTVKGTAFRGSNIYLHPAALLVAIVATAFFKSTEARAFTDNQKISDARGGSAAIRTELLNDCHNKAVVLDAAQSAIILSAVAMSIYHDQPITTDNLLSNHYYSDSLAPTSEGYVADSVSTGTNVELPINTGIWKTGSPADSGGALEDVAHNPAAHTALPLIAILSEISNTPATHAGFDTFATASNISPMLIIIFGAPGAEDNLLPNIQVAKIGYLDARGGVETHTFSEPSQLSATLVGAVQGSLPPQVPKVLADVLQGAVHSAVDARLPENEKSPFANFFFESLKDHQLDAHGATPVDADHATDTSAGQTFDTSSPHTSSLDASPPPPTHQGAAGETTQTADVAAAVLYFLNHTLHWLVTNTDHGIVVYDAEAVGHSSGELTSVSFDFADGSTLSLVGLPAALHDPHIA